MSDDTIVDIRREGYCAFNDALALGWKKDSGQGPVSWMTAEIERLRKQLFDAQQAILREGMEVNRLRAENATMSMWVIQARRCNA